MAVELRTHVPLLTAILSVVALGLVFSAVGGVVPDRLLPRNESLLAVIPQLNALISATAIVTIAAGWRAIRRGAVERHRAFMLTSFLLFVAFLGLYLYRVSLEGPASFGGPAAIEQFVYLPVLAIHILLAIVCVPLLFYVLLLAATRPVEDIYRTRHRSVGQVAAILWVTSFALGIVVYLLLYVVY